MAELRKTVGNKLDDLYQPTGTVLVDRKAALVYREYLGKTEFSPSKKTPRLEIVLSKYSQPFVSLESRNFIYRMGCH